MDQAAEDIGPGCGGYWTRLRGILDQAAGDIRPGCRGYGTRLRRILDQAAEDTGPGCFLRYASATSIAVTLAEARLAKRLASKSCYKSTLATAEARLAKRLTSKSCITDCPRQGQRLVSQETHLARHAPYSGAVAYLVDSLRPRIWPNGSPALAGATSVSATEPYVRAQ